MADQNNLWHPGFYAGIELELNDYHLDFDEEHQVTRGPLSIDLLIIRKNQDEKIDHEIGEFFRQHNIAEFKSPEDELSIDTFFKVQCYAGLYKSNGETVNEIPAQEVTVSLFRDSYPREMVRELEKLGAKTEMRHKGIYEIRNFGLFPTQLIVTGQLEPQKHATLRVLSNEATREDVEAFLTQTMDMRTPGEIARLDAILQVSATANKAIYEQIYKKDERMCAALRDIMQDDFRKAEARGEKRGIQTGEERRNRDNAKGFKDAGVDPAIIASVTGLSAKEVAAL